MNFEKGPQLEEKETKELEEGQIEKRAGELIGKEGEMVSALDGETFKKLRGSGKLKKFLGAMILTSAISAGMTAKAEGGQDWRRTSRRVENVYDRYSRSQRESLRRELRDLEREFRKVDSEGSSIAKKYEREIENVQKYADREVWTMLKDTLEGLKDNLDDDADRIIERYEDRINRAMRSDPERVGDLVYDLNIKLSPHMDEKSTESMNEYLSESDKIYDESDAEITKLHNEMNDELEPYRQEADAIEAKIKEIEEKIEKNERNKAIKDTATSILGGFIRR